MAQAVICEEALFSIFPVIEILIRGYCFCSLVKPFMCSGAVPGGMYGREHTDRAAAKRRGSVPGVGAVYFLIMLALYIMPLSMDTFTAYGIGSLAMFFFICWKDRRNYRQKAFLALIFFSLSWLSTAMAEILYDDLYAFAGNTEYIENHPEMSSALYVGVCVLYLAMELLFTAVGIRQVLKAYKNKSADMEGRELIMMVLPSLMGVTAYKIMQNHRMFYILESGKNKDDYDVLIAMFYAASVAAIVVAIVLYQKIKAKQEENRQAELLAVQIGSIRRHIEQVENFYQNIHSLRHDMTNHILTLERLYEGNKVEEAKAYSKDLKTELIRMTGGIESGNPVTDVIIQEFLKEAVKRGSSFHTDFHYPADSNINAFDISVILNNALQNAIENTEKEAVKKISVVSYRRNNAYIIEVRNSFTGSLQWDGESGLPITSKVNPRMDEPDIDWRNNTGFAARERGKREGHGYGLPNIRRVAGKYAGDIDITIERGEFCLCVLLMLE